MLAPFALSLEISEQLSSKVTAETWVSTSTALGTLRGVTTLDPKAFQMVAPGEETGSRPVIVGLTGVWDSYFAKVKYQFQILVSRQETTKKVNDCEKEQP